MPDYIYNNPAPMSQGAVIQELLSIAQEADPETRGAILSAVGRYAGIAQKPELQAAKFEADSARQTAALNAKAQAQGATLADKAAARQSALEMAIHRGDIQKALLEVKGIQDLSYLAQQQSGKLQELGIKGQQEVQKRKAASDAALEMAQFKHMSKEDFLKLQDEMRIKRQEADYAFELKKKAAEAAESEAIYNDVLGEVSKGPRSARLTTAIGILEQTSPMRAADLKQRMARVEARVVNAVARMGDKKLSAMGEKLTSDDVENIRKAWKEGTQPIRVIDDKVAEVSQRVAAKTEADDLAKSFESLMDKHNVPEPVRVGFRNKLGIVGAADKAATLKSVEAEALAQMASGKRRKLIGGGIAGALVASYLANKFMGGGEADQKAMDPQLQMMLMQQMAKAEQQEGRAQGQELMNMTRAVSLLQKMAQMQGMQADSPAVSMARLM